MMKKFGHRAAVAAFVALVWGGGAAAQPLAQPTPPSVQVVKTELDGPVYADERGHTLYSWDGSAIVAYSGGATGCDDTRYDRSAKGILSDTYWLPDADKRPTCNQQWPPFLASADDKPVGSWTIITRKDGSKQWAFEGIPVVRSSLDEAPGDVNGAMSAIVGGLNRRRFVRAPLWVFDNYPSGVENISTDLGQVLAINDRADMLYVRDPKTAGRAGITKISATSCDAACRGEWRPFLAAEVATATAPWGIIDHDGLRQWTYAGQPLYSRARTFKDTQIRLEQVPGWLPAVIQPRPAMPAAISTVMTAAGPTYADREGKTLYIFQCVEETPDQLFCDVKGASPQYRLSFCGGPEKCRELFKPVMAKKDDKSPNRLWTIVKLDPKTNGRLSDETQPGIYAWAYRGRPVYTYARDEEPGDINAHLYALAGLRIGFQMVPVGEGGGFY